AVTHVDRPGGLALVLLGAFHVERLFVEVGGGVDVLHAKRDVAEAGGHEMTPSMQGDAGSLPASRRIFHRMEAIGGDGPLRGCYGSASQSFRGIHAKARTACASGWHGGRVAVRGPSAAGGANRRIHSQQ